MKRCDIWMPQTATCKKLETKLLRYAFAKHEIAYWKHVLHWNRKKIYLFVSYGHLVLMTRQTSTRHFWKIYRKWNFPNFQIYGFYDFFSLQKHRIYQKPSKFYSLYSMILSYIQNTSNGINYLILPINKNIMRYFFWRVYKMSTFM